MRIILDEAEILDACKAWVYAHYSIDISASPSCGISIITNEDLSQQAAAIFDTDKEGLRKHPFR